LPVGSLPCIFRRQISDFRTTTHPYLFADPVKCAQFRARYSSRRGLVGIAWQTKNEKNGRRRSVNLSSLAPLFQRTDLQWVSLQYGDHDLLQRDVTDANAPIFVDRTVDQLADIDTFAAQVSAMDLVITIDNSTAHFAGALGVPVWVMLPYARDWRWLVGRDDSPWYPTMKLFRQLKPGDWGGVVEKIMNQI
jgi:hypothetical protein